jgi:hypothetical protein
MKGVPSSLPRSFRVTYQTDPYVTDDAPEDDEISDRKFASRILIFSKRRKGRHLIRQRKSIIRRSLLPPNRRTSGAPAGDDSVSRVEREDYRSGRLTARCCLPTQVVRYSDASVRLGFLTPLQKALKQLLGFPVSSSGDRLAKGRFYDHQEQRRDRDDTSDCSDASGNA